MSTYYEVIELLGGMTIVLGALFAFIGKIWLSRVVERNKHELSTELRMLEKDLNAANQKLDAQLQHSVFVSQVQFDREYKIYGEAWGHLVELKIATSQLRPLLDYINPEQTEEERKKERYDKFVDPFNEFSSHIEKNKPFFSAKVYDDLNAVRSECLNESAYFKHGKLGDTNYYEHATENNREIARLIDVACDSI
ncbi:hypothetical protein [Vibrio aestuarianus]|uniref:Uncharacterized protein n=1 Tax=Vibrio aestuarianus TaxID=28171 RepID=A0ABN8TNU6_9VIBR|nr:hypothetical protein [Vibrio aestuarianus]MDE1215578.1 hypothetical protein [Vibrio aestuarianus]MDE1218519.1 hypothetical protein [Vibrio aestuarianus]MDE1259011.1 hypothetical protein [Vibrio aestuarianus]MDE1262701.1 hypothetical protein [Vibrio aestuarianus]MDE1269822.1 hypothetical protein [Vibrio aestuarianus]